MNNEHTDSLIANSAPLAPITAPYAPPLPQAPTPPQVKRNDR